MMPLGYNELKIPKDPKIVAHYQGGGSAAKIIVSNNVTTYVFFADQLRILTNNVYWMGTILTFYKHCVCERVCFVFQTWGRVQNTLVNTFTINRLRPE